MSEQTQDAGNAADLQFEERKAFRSYVWGIGLALLLTLVPFALVYWVALPRFSLLVVIGVLAVAQMVVHFRFFLHIGFRENRDDLHLILFSALLLVIHGGGHDLDHGQPGAAHGDADVVMGAGACGVAGEKIRRRTLFFHDREQSSESPAPRKIRKKNGFTARPS